MTERIKSSEQPEVLEKLIKQVAMGGGIALGGIITGKAVTFGLHVLLGRAMGLEAYGLYALGISMMKIAQFIALLGLSHGIVRFCSLYRGVGDNARIKGIIFSALRISLASSAITSVILFVCSPLIGQRFFHEPNLTWVLHIFALAIPFYVVTSITSSFAQSLRRIDIQQRVQNVFRPVVNLALVCLAFLLGFRLSGAIYGFVASGALSAGLGLYYLCKIFPEIFTSTPVYSTNKLLKFSIPIFFTGILYLLLGYTDRIMLGYFRQANEVGVYSAAYIIASQIPIFLGAFLTIFSPMVSNLYHKRDYGKLEYLFKIVKKTIFSLSLPLVIILSVFSKNIIIIVFGPGFIIGWMVLIVLGFVQLIITETAPAGMLLQMTGKQNIEFVNGIVLLFTNIGLNIWLIPQYGVMGAAVATGISLVFMHILRLIEVAKILKIVPYDKRYFKPLIAGVFAMLVGITLNITASPNMHWIWVLTRIILSLITYVGVLLGMGLDWEDKIVLSAVKRRIRTLK